MRQIMNRFEPRTAHAKHAHLKAILSRQPAERAEELVATLMKLEGDLEHYETMSGPPLVKDISATVLTSPCVKALRERLETANRQMSCKEVRDDILAYFERRRESLAEGPIPMDIGHQEEEEHTCNAPEFQRVVVQRSPLQRKARRGSPLRFSSSGKRHGTQRPGAGVVGEGRVHQWEV